MVITLTSWCPVFTIAKNPMFSDKSRLFLEKLVAYIYRKKQGLKPRAYDTRLYRIFVNTRFYPL